MANPRLIIVRQIRNRMKTARIDTFKRTEKRKQPSITEMNTPGKIAIIHIQRSAKEIRIRGIGRARTQSTCPSDFAFAITGDEIVQPIEMIPIRTEPEERQQAAVVSISPITSG